MCCDNVRINKKTQFIYIYIYIPKHTHIYICIKIYNKYNIYIKLDNRMYSYTIIYSYTVDVNLMLICIELSEM